MSLDLAKLRSKLEVLKNPKLKTSKFEKKTWSPVEGEVKRIRLIKQADASDPFHELWFHYGLGKAGSILCPNKNARQGL